MRHPVQPLVGGRGEDPLEQLGRVPDLGAVQPDADHQVAVGQQPRQQRLGLRRVAVAQEAGDQPGGDPVPLLRPPANASPRPSSTTSSGTPAGQVRLRVDEHLGVPHALRGGPGEVGLGEVGEVLAAAAAPP